MKLLLSTIKHSLLFVLHRKEHPKNSIYSKKYLEAADNDVERALGGIWDETSYLGRRFRRMFRLPYTAFYDLHRTLVQDGVWDVGVAQGAVAFDLVDCRLLLLGSLAALGCSITWEHISDGNGCSITQNKDFFKTFIEWGHEKATQEIRLPNDIDAIRDVTKEYERLLFPGCVGSMDGIHFRWDACPAGLRNECIGRGKKPTVAFQMVATHRRQIIGVSKGKCLRLHVSFVVVIAINIIVASVVFSFRRLQERFHNGRTVFDSSFTVESAIFRDQVDHTRRGTRSRRTVSDC